MKNSLATAEHQDPSAYELAAQIASACAEAKGRELEVLSLKELSDMFDYFVIVSGRSDRQVQGICNRILDMASEHGISPSSVDGMEKAHWVVLDFGDVVVHVFYEPMREHYDLESLWAKAPRIPLKGLEQVTAT